MNELMITLNHQMFRRRLLSTVSALAVVTSAAFASEAVASDGDSDRPTIWIELGGQLDRLNDQSEPFAPGFLEKNSGSSVLQLSEPLQAQKLSPFSFGEEGKISLQPAGSDWVFSAAVRYSRSSKSKNVHHQTYGLFHTNYKYGAPNPPNANFHATDNFADIHVKNQESHTVLDFSAGKDVGLGLFGSHASSILSVGVRFAQFASNSAFDIRARPDLHFFDKYFQTFHFTVHLPYFHTYHATGQASRSFRGIGPSLSWTGSAPILGTTTDGEVSFDWGANASLLFGKQKAHVEHQESGHFLGYASFFQGGHAHLTYHYTGEGRDHIRNVTVPNVGGFAGATFRVENFKVSAGYRADFFFGALDGGINAPKSETLGFYGPFATISIGLGG